MVGAVGLNGADVGNYGLGEGWLRRSRVTIDGRCWAMWCWEATVQHELMSFL